MWRVYEADGTVNSDWNCAVDAQHIVSAHPGWCYGFVHSTARAGATREGGGMDKIIELLTSIHEGEPWYICDVVVNHCRRLWGAKAVADIADRIDDGEYVTLDAVLGRGRHDGDSGCDLGNMPT